MRSNRPDSALVTACLVGITFGCAREHDESVQHVALALVVGPELTLYPDLPGGFVPIGALGHTATASIAGVRATAWSAGGAGSIAFWSSARGRIAQERLGSLIGRPQVATDGRVFLVVWQDISGVSVRRYDASGVRMDSTAILISATGDAGADGDALTCLYDGRDFVIAHAERSSGVLVTRVTGGGAVRDRRAVPLLGASIAEHVRLARTSAGYLVAASGTYSASFMYDHLQYARLDTGLTLLDATPRQIAATPRERSLEEVASDGTDYLLLWSDDATPTTGAPRLLAARVAASTGTVATPVDVGPASTPRSGGGAWAERASGGYLIGRYEGSSFTTRQLRDTGALVESAPVARTSVMGLTGQVSRFPEGSGLTLTWTRVSGTIGVLDTTVMDLAGTLLAPVTQPLPTPGGTHITALGLDWDGSEFGVAWTELYGSAWSGRVGRDGSRVGARSVALSSQTYPETLTGTPGQHLLVRRSSAIVEQIYDVQLRDPTFGVLGATNFYTTDRMVNFTAAGGPSGYLVATNLDTLGGLTTDLHFLRANGSVARASSLFRFRPDHPNVSFAANRDTWTVAWIRAERMSTVTEPVLIVSQFTPTGEFASVPMELGLGVQSMERPNTTVASNGTDFLIAWNDVSGAPGLFGLRMRADGTRIDPTPFRIGSWGGALRSVWDGRSYTLAWRTPVAGTPLFTINALRVGTSGGAIDPAPVELATGAAAGFAMATDGAGTLALTYGKIASDDLVRTTVRVFNWGAAPGDAGVDAMVDVPVADIPVDRTAPMPDAVTDLGVMDVRTDTGPFDAVSVDSGSLDGGSPDGTSVDAVSAADTSSEVGDGMAGDERGESDVVTDAGGHDAMTLPDGTPGVDVMPQVDAAVRTGEDSGGICSAGGVPGRSDQPTAFLGLAGIALATRRKRLRQKCTG